MHTLVMVRLIRRKGAIYRFLWWRCEGFLSEEKMDMAFHLVTPRRDCFFVSRQKKIKMNSSVFIEEPKLTSTFVPTFLKQLLCNKPIL